MMLTRDDLIALATPVYGSEWQSALARERGVSRRTVSRWAADGIAKPETAVAVRAYLVSRCIIDIPTPASRDDDDRDDQARDIAAGLLATIVEAGERVGWHEAEMLAGIMSAAVDRMVDGAGVPATRETMKQVVAQLGRQSAR